MENQELRLEIAKTMLLMRFPFFGYIVSRLNISKNDKIGTFAINERCDVFYSPKFLDKLSDSNLLTVLAHEALHAVFMHFTHFSKTIDHDIMNLACDIEINDILVNIENMNMPMASVLDIDGSGGKIPNENQADDEICGFAPNKEGNFVIIYKQKNYIIKCRDKSSIEIYDELYDILQKIKKEYAYQLPFSGNMKGGPRGFDEHQIGELSKSEQAEEENRWGEVLIGADVYQDSVNPKKTRTPNGCWYKRYIDKILTPQVDWRAVLRKYLIELIPFNYSYNLPARKSYAINIYEPKILRKPLGITVCIDVSGSIGTKELQEFLSEVVGIAKTSNEISIRRLYWSTVVDDKNDEVFTRKNLRQLFTPSKNIHTTGGTTISCVKEYLDRHRDRKNENLVIYLTDGYVENKPQMHKKSLVIISPNGSDEIFKKTKIPFVKMKKRRD